MSFLDGIFQYQVNTIANTQSARPAKGVSRPLLAQAQELIPGKVFEGTVTDMKQGQVTIGLSDGRTISARMEPGVSLQKGEPMLFEVKASTEEQISIRPVTLESAQNPTLIKALEAAGLKANPRNLSMVNQMMMEQMPIDKNSLLLMARATGNFPQADMQALVQMQKLGFEINENSLNQFQNYKNGQQAMLPELQALMEGLSELPEQMFGKEAVLWNPGGASHAGSGSSPVVSFQQQLLEALLGNNYASGEAAQVTQQAGTGQGILDAAGAGQILQEAGVGQGIPDAAAGAGGGQGIPDGAGAGQILQEAGVGQGIPGAAAGAGGGQGIPDAAAGAGQGVPDALGTGQRSQEAASVDPSARQLPEGNGMPAQDGADASGPIGQALTSKQQASLTGLLQAFSGAEESGQLFKGGRLDANQTAVGLLRQIMDLVAKSNHTDSDLAKKLFSSKEYKALLKQAMADQWFLSPEQLKEEGAVKNLYERMSRQMSDLQQMLTQTGKEGSSLAKTAQSVQNNLEFINQLNQAYTYMQLPLKLQNQNAHSDLYVYTNKKNLRDKEGELSALLHLDMEHLGSTDIYVKLKGTAVQADFYFAEEAAYRLVAGATDRLVERLAARGYQCDVKVENRKQQQDFVQDFLEHEKPSGKLHRYSFDVKA